MNARIKQLAQQIVISAGKQNMLGVAGVTQELLDEVDRLEKELAKTQVELAGYKRNAAYIASCIDSDGVYRP
jgi:hypothetical protein